MIDDDWTPAGGVEDLRDGACRPAACGQALVARVDGKVVAYRNRCLHKGAQLHDGLVRDGVLTCPLHFWRYRLSDGRRVGSDVGLEPLPVTVVDGEILVRPPTPPTAPASMRELLLDHARTWRRDA